jgi:flavin-dependent dehydrogenase
MLEVVDVVICGGGIAGLTLARQLKLRRPATRVVLIDKLKRPLPVAAHAVGESAVEVGAHYLIEVLQLEEYFADRHLPKFGLRFWFGDGTRPFAERTEYGPRMEPAVPSLHVDRGVLETDLRTMNEESGVTMLEGHRIESIHLDPGGVHEVTCVDLATGERRTVRARWVIDATGRRRMLQSKLQLTCESGHDCSAAWWRTRGLCDVSELLGRVSHDLVLDDRRWLSTNHLMGPGYWVWLIPLGSDHMSVGIVADETLHPIARYNSYEKALAWLRENEAPLADYLADFEICDFLALKRYSHWSRRVFSEDRWACVGDAGAFADPLYSPGGDFIGYSNSIVCRMVEADLAGELSKEDVDSYNEFLLHDLGLNTLAFYKGMYPAFGSARAMVPKTHWDTSVYWGMQAPLMFNGCLSPSDLRRYSPVGKQLLKLNQRMQRIFLQWSKLPAPPRDGGFVPYSGMPLFLELQGELARRKGADEVLSTIERNLVRFEAWARVLTSCAIQDGLDPTVADDLGAADAAVASAALELERQSTKHVIAPVRAFEARSGGAI